MNVVTDEKTAALDALEVALEVVEALQAEEWPADGAGQRIWIDRMRAARRVLQNEADRLLRLEGRRAK